MNKQVTNKDDIIKLILKEQERLVSLGVVSIGLFGSFVRGDQNSSSDIDFLIEPVSFANEYLRHIIENICFINIYIMLGFFAYRYSRRFQ